MMSHSTTQLRRAVRIATAIRRWLLLAVVLATSAQAAQPPNAASAYPSKPIKIYVPFSAGSASDVLARIVAESLASRWGQPVVVENRPGAGGTIGAALVAKAEPDGYSLLMVSVGHVVNPQLYAKLPYDTLQDFTGVAALANLPSVLVVPPKLDIGNVKALVAMARARPGELNYTTGGIGSGSHISVEKFRVAAGIDTVHVPTKGAQEMMVEIMTGRAHFGFLPIIVALAPIRDGRLAAVAVSSAERSPVLPNVPTIAEAGMPEATFDFWIGLLAPSRTPPEIVSKLHAEISSVLESPDVKRRLDSLGAQPMPMTPARFNAYMREEYDALGRLMKNAAVTGQ